MDHADMNDVDMGHAGMQPPPQVPRPALVLGWAGVSPFAALAALTITGGVGPSGGAAGALVLYGAIILAFMGGAQWGLAMSAVHGAPGDSGGAALGARLSISVLPAVAAFGLWFWPPTAALLGLAIVFIALLLHDIALARAGAAPAWYPALRLQLTCAVVVCLLVAALGSRQ